MPRKSRPTLAATTGPSRKGYSAAHNKVVHESVSRGLEDARRKSDLWTHIKLAAEQVPID